VEECIFCKFINKEIPAKFVYEDEQVVAFDDANPAAPVHILIIPREHISSLHDITAEKKDLAGHLIWVINEIAREKKLESYRVLTNCGAGAGQVVFHLHFHLLGGRKFNR
jgi:histidine triad (HIT) family protein